MIEKPHVYQSFRMMLETAGLPFDPDRTYALSSQEDLSKRLDDGWEVVLNHVNGRYGEEFILVGRTPEEAP